MIERERHLPNSRVEPHVMTEILEDRTTVTIEVELGELVDQGLLNMGISESGETLYWPTESGCEQLGMTPV